MNLPPDDQLEIQAVSAAFVLEASLPERTLAQAELRRWLMPPLTFAQLAEGGVSISSMKDQRQVMLRANRIDIRDLSGGLPGRNASSRRGRSSTGEIARMVFGHFEISSLVAYGLNYELTVPGTVNAARYIADALLDSRKMERWPIDIVGAGVKLIYRAGDNGEKRITLDLEPDPRADTVEAAGAVFANANVHQGSHIDLNTVLNELDSELAEQFQRVLQVLRVL